ncbi:P1 family peptidase [Arthrobacter sulfonylureivorans]|uniref:P1 family peptidase n=1 Tax=Arthrobacter sulfonylureivorans TaxID=2486855 RepID=A0ABY3W8U4_9MICC|nr:P1 family peptidase [Arthrobacter sulfonylureivorans]UNK46782.1 P1 family peptidase [Arthrobacter sulfonylureivorans]
MASSITDVPGIRVGQVQKTGDGWLTGVTVVLPPPGTVGAVDVRGGGPATHETDALDPTTLVPTVDAVVLAGGSAFGLIAAHGAQRWLEEQGLGYRTANAVVPIVPAAAIYDLGRGGDITARPDEQMGYDAAASAGAMQDFGAVQRGNVGAGTGAAMGFQQYKGGVGTASLRMSGANDGVVVGALAVVNAVGMPFHGAGSGAEGLHTGAARPGRPPGEDGAAGGPPGEDAAAGPPPGFGTSAAPLNTTLCVVATNAVLDPAQAKRAASAAHAGLARALSPSHTLMDGDVVFTLATGAQPLVQKGPMDARAELHVLAAEAVTAAIRDAVVSAERVEGSGVVLEKYPYPD